MGGGRQPPQLRRSPPINARTLDTRRGHAPRKDRAPPRRAEPPLPRPLTPPRASPCAPGTPPPPSKKRSIEQYPDAKVVPGVVIVRLDAPIYFANCTYFQDKLEDYEAEGVE